MILVTGSTGNAGGAVVRSLARHGQRVRAGSTLIGSADLGRNLRSEALSDDGARTEMSERMPAEYVDALFRFCRRGRRRIAGAPTVGQVTGGPPVPSDDGRAHAAAFREPGAGP